MPGEHTEHERGIIDDHRYVRYELEFDAGVNRYFESGVGVLHPCPRSRGGVGPPRGVGRCGVGDAARVRWQLCSARKLGRAGCIWARFTTCGASQANRDQESLRRQESGGRPHEARRPNGHQAPSRPGHHRCACAVTADARPGLPGGGSAIRHTILVCTANTHTHVHEGMCVGSWYSERMLCQDRLVRFWLKGEGARSLALCFTAILCCLPFTSFSKCGRARTLLAMVPVQTVPVWMVPAWPASRRRLRDQDDVRSHGGGGGRGSWGTFDASVGCDSVLCGTPEPLSATHIIAWELGGVKGRVTCAMWQS